MTFGLMRKREGERPAAERDERGEAPWRRGVWRRPSSPSLKKFPKRDASMF